jgi:hypothetical protein
MTGYRKRDVEEFAAQHVGEVDINELLAVLWDSPVGYENLKPDRTAHRLAKEFIDAHPVTLRGEPRKTAIQVRDETVDAAKVDDRNHEMTREVSCVVRGIKCSPKCPHVVYADRRTENGRCALFGAPLYRPDADWMYRRTRECRAVFGDEE